MKRSVLVLALVFLGVPARSEAGVVLLSMDSKTVAAGSKTATLDVHIQGDAIQAFQVAFTISDGTTTQLEFLGQDDPGEGPTLEAGGYVFHDDSYDIRNSGRFGTASPPQPPPVIPYATTFTGGDFTDSGENVDVTGNNNLLVRLLFKVPEFTSIGGKDIFTITLDQGQSSFSDAYGNPVSLANFDPVSGTLTVVADAPVSAVPEPASLAAAASGALALVTAALFRWRGPASRPKNNMR